MGTRKDEKGQRFEFLIRRIDEALDEGFYVETIAITYALFEERTYRLLDRLNVSYRKRDKLYDCLVKLENAINSGTVSVTTTKMNSDKFNDLLKDLFITSNLILDIHNWRDSRNDVMHDLAKTNMDYEGLKTTCESGRDLFRKYTAIIMKLKKNIDETSV